MICLAVAAGASLPSALGGSEAESATKKVKFPRKPGCTVKWNKKKQRGRNVDRDRLPNIVDPDIDGDRKKNGSDTNIDGDKRLNQVDRDMDADGIPNQFDRDIDSDRRPNTKDRDMDADRIKNARDSDMDADGAPNQSDVDVDGDCLLNGVDPDIDGDGIANAADPDAYTSGPPVVPPPAPGGPRVPASFFGMVSEEVAATRGAERERLLDIVDATGARSIRQTFEWAQIERSPEVYDWRWYDDYVKSVTARGYTLLPILFNPPQFRSSNPGDPERGTYPPKSNNDFAAFAAKAVRRYGPGGSFWAENPALPARPIRAWQVWNEPNILFYWPDGPNPAAYTAMLRAVSAAIGSVDPGAEVVAAGMPESPGAGHMGLADFIRGMYRAGARGTFDTMAIHPYSSAVEGSVAMLDMVRTLMNDNGDSAVSLWVTEIGWASGGPPYPFNVGPVAQAENIRRLFTALVDQKDRLRLRGVTYWRIRDYPPYANRPPTWTDHVGLYDANGRPKPALDAYVSTVRALTSG